MFNEAPEQFHQFITTSRTTQPQPLSFPDLHATPNSFLPFDPFNTFHQLLLPHQAATQYSHPSQHQSPTHKDEEKEANYSMETCFQELTNWEQASRKLAELGFKKSAENCKEKFGDESMYFNNINFGKSDQFLSELEELCQGDQNPYRVVTEKNNQQHEKSIEERDKIMGYVLEEDQEYSRNMDPPVTKPCDGSDKMVVEKSKDKKRKRRGKFEMFKGFCESIVTKIMAQQEEIHNKLLEDMLKRDEEKLAKEEEWKKQEMNKMNKELEMMAQEQAIESDRHAIMIGFLKKYAPSSLARPKLECWLKKE